MLLTSIVKSIIFENEDSSLSTDPKMVEKTLKDTFEVSATGLDFFKTQLEKLEKKAKRIGVQAPSYKIVSERDLKYIDKSTDVERTKHLYTIKVEGKSPIIEGYEFIASIEHTEVGNIINISPSSSVREVPSSYRNSTPTCDYCHTKRDRLNTFILKKDGSNEFMKVGRGCLKNFLNGKDPKEILEYANYLSFILSAAVSAEGMSDESFGGEGGRSYKYYNSDDFLLYVCMAYLIKGRYISRSKAQEGETPTAQFALLLMMPPKGDTVMYDLIRQNYSKAKHLFDELSKWMDEKDWDKEIQSNPSMGGYFHNLKVVANLPSVQYKNSNLHASILAVFLREKAYQEKKRQDAAKPRAYIGEVGGKVSFIGTVKKTREFDSQWGTTCLVQFEDENGNEIIWWSSRYVEESPDVKWKVTATVKKHELSKYTQHPQTVITRAKMEPLE